MKNKKLVIATANPLFFHHASASLTQLGFRILHVNPDAAGTMLASAQAVVTTAPERLHVAGGNMKIFTFDDTCTRENVRQFAEVVKITVNPVVIREESVIVDIGIDPGDKVTGLALHVNKKLVDVRSIPTSRDGIVRFIRKGIHVAFAQGTPDTPPVTIKVGNGHAVCTRHVVDWLLSMDESASFKVELVNEFQTNSNGCDARETGKLADHERAAIAIASRQGQPVDGELERWENKRFSRKQLKGVQNESRKTSMGKISITKDAAQRVLLGQITMEDAIDQQRLSRTRGTVPSPGES